MVPEYFYKGLIIGFSVAAPVGPIGVLTIKRTLSEGRLSGFVTGMGAAVADTAYGMVAGFGLTMISSFLLAQGFWLKLIGGLFLVYLGLRSFASKPVSNETALNNKGLWSNFISTFFLTITNPATILSFLAIFAGFGVATEPANWTASSMLVLGVFTGSALWWLLLSFTVGAFRSKVTLNGMVWVNRLSGLVIISFGAWALYSSMK